MQFLPLLAVHAVVQPDARPRDIEARRPNDHVEIVLDAVGGDEAGGRDGGDSRVGEGDVGEVEGREVALVVRCSLEVQSCWRGG